MADLTTARPYEPTKAHWLHDQDKLPAMPSDRSPLYRYLGLIAFGLAMGVGLTLLGFEIRAGWESHRDWVIPVIAQFCAIAGICAAHLAWRGAIGPLMTGLFFATGVLVMVIGIVWINEARANPEPEIDWIRAIAGIVLGITVATFILGSVWTEWRTPTRGPERTVEM